MFENLDELYFLYQFEDCIIASKAMRFNILFFFLYRQTNTKASNVCAAANTAGTWPYYPVRKQGIRSVYTPYLKGRGISRVSYD